MKILSQKISMTFYVIKNIKSSSNLERVTPFRYHIILNRVLHLIFPISLNSISIMFFQIKINMNLHKSILTILGKERIVTSSEIAEKLKVSWNTAEKGLLELTIEGKIERIKKAGVNLWTLK